MDLFELSATIGLDTKSFKDGLDLAGQAFGAFADAVVGFSRDVLDTGLGFDKAMGSVQAVLGREEGTVENMNKLRQFAMDQARKSIFTTEEAADAYYYMGMAGWKTEQMLGGLPGIMALAAASGEDLASVSDIVTDSMTAFGWGADRATEYADILAATVTNSNTDVSQLGTAFKYAAPLAGNFGLDVKDIAASLGLMASQGIKGSQAGTTLRSMMQRLAADTNDARGTLESLGVQVFDSNGKMRDWSDIIDDTRTAFAGLSDEQKSNIAYTVAGKTGMSGFLALINAGTDDVKKLTKALEESGGAAQWMADTRLDNLSGDIEYFNSELNVLKTSLYDNVKDPMREVVQEGTEGLRRITDAIQEDGVIGGLKQLSAELRNIKDNETFQEFVKAAGDALGEIVTLLPELGIDIFGAVESLGASFAKGLTTGISENLKDSHPFLAQLVGGIFGPDTSNGRGPLDVPALVKNGKLDVELVPTLASNSIQAAIDEAKANEQTTVTIDGIEFDIETPAEQIAKELGYVGLDAGKTMASNLSDEVTKAAPDGVGKPIRSALSDAGRDGGADLTSNVSDSVTQDAPGIGDILSAFIGNSGDSAGSTFATLFGGILGSESFGMRNDLESVLGDAGSGAGWDIASDIQSALNFANFTVRVVGVVSQVINTVRSVFSHNASAMSSGRIYNRPTVFGYYDNAYQVAGDAGPEAVVGVNSLQRMITNAVHSANAGSEVFVPREAQSRPVTVIMQVGEKEFGRLAFELGSAEEQRVGVRLAKGGAY